MFLTNSPSGRDAKAVLHKHWEKKLNRSRAWKTGSRGHDFRNREV